MTTFDCLDCGVDTSRSYEYYMIHGHLWLQVNPQGDGMLCILCCEDRLGRQLRAYDFTDCPLNDLDNPWEKSALLIDRLTTVPTPVVPVVYK